MSENISGSRRFSSVSRVYGDEGVQRLWQSHVVVIGIGGVGSWAAEALARSGVGTLTLIDLDHVAESNINRQVHALSSTVGAAKVDVMAARIREISPDITVHTVDAFIEPGEEDALIPADADAVIDAIDAVSAKASLIAWCVARKLPVVVCGAAGGRTDPLQLQVDDLARTQGDALLSSVRARLRKHHGFARGDGLPAVTKTAAEGRAVPAASGGSLASEASVNGAQAVARSAGAKKRAGSKGLAPRFGVEAIFSREQSVGTRVTVGGGMPLACAGYGSLVTVTAAMGLAAASRVLEYLTSRKVSPVREGSVQNQRDL
ncbi:MAG: tRNA threonylcarbamoyladenosine dehydratase [Lautropia sp.]|nr:tRNA threonylcarbamoyladenosine dehydratase [Lautropia sp.]